MKRLVITTNDGSHSISIPDMLVTYHSVHGAIQESMHVFIKAGLLDAGLFDHKGVHEVLEIGFGTGLNALLTLVEAEKHQNRIDYTSLELYPLVKEEWQQLNYCEQLPASGCLSFFEKIHSCAWNELCEISEHFRLTKLQTDIHQYQATEKFSIIYFDAFAPGAQPDLWTKEIFEKMYRALIPGGVLVTYCSKGEVRRNMQAAGFLIEKIPGPPGKREMVRAKKAGSE